MRCDPVGVTALVDGELPATLSNAIERHLVECRVCADQAEFEAEVAERLRSLPPIDPPPGLVGRIQALSSSRSAPLFG